MGGVRQDHWGMHGSETMSAMLIGDLMTKTSTLTCILIIFEGPIILFKTALKGSKFETNMLGGSMGLYQMLVTLRVTARLVLLMLLATVRCVYCVVEQPRSSLMTFFPYMTWLAGLVGKLYVWRTVALSWAKLSL